MTTGSRARGSRFRCGWTLAVALLASSCRAPGPEVRPMKPIQQVLEERTPELLRREGVVGTAEGEHDGHPVVLVLLRADDPALRRALPRTLDGYPVEVRVVGDVRPLRTR
jgi:hypothetical protein